VLDLTVRLGHGGRVGRRERERERREPAAAGRRLDRVLLATQLGAQSPERVVDVLPSRGALLEAGDLRLQLVDLLVAAVDAGLEVVEPDPLRHERAEAGEALECGLRLRRRDADDEPAGAVALLRRPQVGRDDEAAEAAGDADRAARGGVQLAHGADADRHLRAVELEP
jgi:hypothetical protein